MADNRTMVEFLQAPTEGYEDAIIIPEIAANNFELKYGLINLVQNKQFFRHDKEDLHAHIRFIELCCGWKLFGQNTRECLKIIERKSKVRQTRAKAVVAKVSTSSSTPSISSKVSELKDMVRALLLDKKNQSSALASSSTPAPVKAIEPNYVTCGDMSFEISFTDALILMPKFASTLKALIGNKEKLSEMGRIPMNEHCSAVILNKFPRKLGNPDKFLIPCEFPGMDECLALADLGASINLMPHSMWEGLSLLELTPTCMTLELADRSVSKPIGITKDVLVKVGVFHFPADFVVVDFKPDPPNVTASGNPTPYDDPIVSTTSPTLTPFGDSDSLLFEEADAFLGLVDDPNLPEFNSFYYDPKGDILLLEAF
uniref:Reverse transcriptase domain-containing protein n=1 Tax=Tanacetum cinerariifolium TaxID=118510 RepID=A0A6L2MWS3_TANCI|nr:reverse transcriptase domain-containing protein [Tanacetum cinerariifolium]